jgi:hypothetical protein
MVGAGGIGCELLKTLVLSGFEDIEMARLRGARGASVAAQPSPLVDSPRCADARRLPSLPAPRTRAAAADRHGHDRDEQPEPSVPLPPPPRRHVQSAGALRRRRVLAPSDGLARLRALPPSLA